MKALPVYLQWLILLACSLALGLILQHYHVPAALLLGPMMVGLVMALSGARIAISPKVFIGCQAILGCMIAGALSPSILSVLVSDWLPVVLTLAVTLLASGLSGWLLVRFSSLPGPTGAWGGASAMVAVGAILGRRLRIPAGPLLLPMVAGATLHATGTLTLQVPEWLLALAYAFIGWSVGLRFTSAIVLLALKTLPQMLASIAGLMLLCGAMDKIGAKGAQNALTGAIVTHWSAYQIVSGGGGEMMPPIVMQLRARYGNLVATAQ